MGNIDGPFANNYQSIISRGVVSGLAVQVQRYPGIGSSRGLMMMASGRK